MPAPGLPLFAREFRVPRRGHRLEDCEDVAALAPERGRFAVADGAAESSFAALWARLLVEDFVQTSQAPSAWAIWSQTLPPLRQRWAAAIQRAPGTPALPWYLEARLDQ